MSTNVLNKDYEQLQESISKFRADCYEQLTDKQLVSNQEIPTTTTPIIPQLDLTIDYVQFEGFVTKLIALIEEKQPQLIDELKKLSALFNIETAEKLIRAAIEMNTSYFQKVAQEQNVEEWLVPFVIENVTRPYLQKAAVELKDSLEKVSTPHHCPACGEPPRLAVINKTGKKELVCPRCYYAWEEKKISCPHCGTDNHEHIVILQVDEDSTGEVYGCKNCNSYTKVIKTSSMIRVPAPDMLDIKTIHLDYIAQEKGFGSVEEGTTSH